MDGDSRRLVDDEEVLVFPRDPEVEILRLQPRPAPLDLDRHLLPTFQAMAFRPQRSVDDDLPIRQQALGRRTRADTCRGGEEPVQPLPGSFGRDDERDRGAGLRVVGGGRLGPDRTRPH
jgi:hypothetical protein